MAEKLAHVEVSGDSAHATRDLMRSVQSKRLLFAIALKCNFLLAMSSPAPK